MAAHISTWWTMWQSNRNLALDRWDELYKYIFATSTRDTTNETVTDFSNTTHRPKIGNIFDTLTINYDAALFPNDNWLRFKGSTQDSADKRKRKIVESYMRTKHSLRSSGFRKEMRKCENDWVHMGNAFAMVDYVNEVVVDEDLNDVTTAYTGPRVTRLNPRDIVFNPTATSFARAPKIVRSLFTIAELHRIVEENPRQQHFKEILETAKSHRGIIQRFEQGDILEASELSFDGFSSPSMYLQSGLIEVLDFYGDIWIPETDEFRKNHVITVVDRWKIVRDEPIKTWSGNPHIYHVGWRDRPGDLWAMGPLDNLVGMQYRMNHLENARADAFDQMLDPDMVFAGEVEDVVQVGGARHYYIAENGNVAHLTPDTTVLNADFQIKELEEAMELFALAPREALGVRSPGEKTKFEVRELATAASRSFEHKVLIYQEFLEEIVNGELEEAVRNLNATDIIEIIDDDTGAAEFRSITKKDLTANGRLVPVGARHFGRAQQLTQDLLQLQQGPLADPEVAMHFSSKGLAEMYQELLELRDNNPKIVEPYIRVAERLEAQRRMQVAEDQALQESLTQAQPLEEEDVGEQLPV
jgi:hypothetical protein